MNRKLLLLVLFVLMSCGTQKVLPIEQVTDSVSVIFKESVIYKDTIIYVEVPAESDRTILPDTDTSRLETSIAESEAWVSNGKLNHTLKNKSDVSLPKIISIPIYLKSKESEHIANNVVVKEIEKELTKWQQLRLTLGTILLISVAVLIAYKIVKVFV